MRLELLGIILTAITPLISVGYFFGKLNSRLDEIEEKIDEISSEVFKDKIIKISDFIKKKK